jgi:glutamine amidotransferase
VHSFAAKRWEVEPQHPFLPAKLTYAHHGEDFVAAVEDGPLAATQFHPEKSGEAGRRLLVNWLESLR